MCRTTPQTPRCTAGRTSSPRSEGLRFTREARSVGDKCQSTDRAVRPRPLHFETSAHPSITKAGIADSALPARCQIIVCAVVRGAMLDPDENLFHGPQTALGVVRGMVANRRSLVRQPARDRDSRTVRLACLARRHCDPGTAIPRCRGAWFAERVGAADVLRRLPQSRRARERLQLNFGRRPNVRPAAEPVAMARSSSRPYRRRLPSLPIPT